MTGRSADNFAGDEPLVLRPSGTSPFWAAGSQITWREGAGPLGTAPLATNHSSPHFAQPMTVVRDDPEALVAWLPTGTPVLRAARRDGQAKRADPTTLFTTGLRQERGTHRLYDQLRIAPTGKPWSVWLLFEEGSGEFSGWYVNLEQPHLRNGLGIYTIDHVLDLVISPGRLVTRKDEDELVLARQQGAFDDQEVAAIEADLARVEEAVARWGSPFCDGWENFRPDPLWPTPTWPDNSHPGG